MAANAKITTNPIIIEVLKLLKELKNDNNNKRKRNDQNNNNMKKNLCYYSNLSADDKPLVDRSIHNNSMVYSQSIGNEKIYSGSVVESRLKQDQFYSRHVNGSEVELRSK